MPLTFFSSTHVSEFYVPFLHHQASALIYSPYDRPDIGPEIQNNFCCTFIIAAIYGIESDSTPIDFSIFGSYADEATVGVFQGLPKVEVLRTAGGASPFPDLWFSSSNRHYSTSIDVISESDDEPVVITKQPMPKDRTRVRK